MTRTTYTVEYIEDGADTPTRFTYNAEQRVSAVQRARRLSLTFPGGDLYVHEACNAWAVEMLAELRGVTVESLKP